MNNKIKIAHIIYGLKYGGAEKLLLTISAKLNKEKFTVVILALTCGGPMEGELKKHGIDVIVLRYDGKFYLTDFFRLLKILKKQRVDIVHTHLRNADLWAGLAARICGIKHVSTFHGAYFKYSILELLKQRLRVFLPHRIITVSQATASQCISELKAKKEKLSVIYNGVDLKAFEVVIATAHKKRQIGIAEDAFVIGTVGRIEIEKGHIYLLEAIPDVLKKQPKTIFLIIGEGSLKEELIKMVKEMGIEANVKFLGERDDVPELLKVMNIVVIPSLFEGFSLVALEAMASGTPVIATSVEGTPELISNGKEGLLITPKDKFSLIQNILLLIQEKNIANQIASKAKEKIKQEFTDQKMLDRLERLYEEVLH